MYKTLILACLSISFLIGCNDAPPPKKKADHTAAKKEIRAAFNNYKNATLSKEGTKTTQYITKSTLVYFENILEKVKFADKETILGSSIADQTQILIIRRFFSKEEVLSFDGKAVYAATIDKGLMGEQLKTMSIGLVLIKGGKGKAQMILDGTKTAVFFDFLKEDKQWKLDITTTLVLTTKSIEAQAEEAKISTTEFLLEMLQLNAKEREQIWEPLDHH